MAEEPARIETFAYQAQTPQGQTLSGTIDAGDVDAASLKLQSLQLRITGLEPTRRPTARAILRGADFLAFNQQLAQLTAGGLPIERSLRLLASEIRGAATRAVNEIAQELEKGTPLDAAFAKHGSGFPPLYGALVKAGIQSNNLPGILLNLGRHVEMMQRLRGAIWRAATYPLSVLAALLVVLAFVWTCVIPKFAPLLVVPAPMFARSGGLVTPPSFDWLISVAGTLNLVLMLLIAFVLFSVLVLAIVARLPAGRSLVEPIVMPLPLIGPILRWNLLARWCDALRLGVEAGLDLPAALSLAHSAIDSPRLQADGRTLMDAVAAGKPIDTGTTQLLPPLVPAALQLGIEQNDLAATTNMLAKMYQEQAEIRLSVLPQVLSPLLLILTAVSVGLAVLVVVLPLAAVLRWLSH